MSKIKNIITAFIILSAVVLLTASCKKDKDKPNYNSDKTKLNLRIDSANALYNTAVEGKQAGDYTTGAKATLKTSIDLASQVKTGSFTQEQVDNATANLMRALVQFSTKLIQEISADNLVAYWKFDGDAKDASGNGHDGLLKTGWVGSSTATALDGGTVPVLTTDRYGASGKAYTFNNGAYIEVPYNSTLRPNSFTISAWVKPHMASNGNYIFSLNRWLGYKFQLQGGNLPFLTVNTDTGDHDQDDGGAAVQLDKWTQVIVSFTNGTEKFYINSVLVKTANVTGNPLPLVSPPNLAIGNELPKSAYNFTDSNSPNAFYGAGFFIGAIDEVRLYNKALSDAEVNSLYTMEQP
ncbi:LamG domain-containing protein [Mucilaginibacter sabulilitoris]|uniref:LamG domain-containing protein n=1 Tax=Mucilaginibacter sabulilitoris TaxID=1173583 RepID=A0ABZ0TV84_9SPHI|nr:LamG domain-containing protein [Mucilaginibacter sabulilitoris]WPU97019.1 LamG domain-containing protein [Mucilaginibacter sabulilitoris]